jgi:pyruvate dehydrogenase E2 component (dihydrolipoamide acetyltransferase)
MATEFKLPDLGENIEGGDVVNVLVSAGDTIEDGQSVLELETDKAVVEIPCSLAGRVAQIHVKAGDHVTVGQLVLTVDADGAAAGAGQAAVAAGAVASAKSESKAPAKESASEPVASKAPRTPVAAGPSRAAAEKAEPSRESALASPLDRATREAPGAIVPASPSVRRLARELGVELRDVEGTGPGSRVTAEDVKRHVRETMSGAPSGVSRTGAPAAPALPDFNAWGPTERRPLRGIRKKVAEHVSASWATAPHVTQFDLADVTELEAARKRYVTRKREAAKAEQAKGDEGSPMPVPSLTMTVLVMKAVVRGLQEFPQFNASFDPATGELVLKQYYHLGIAVDTEHGLIVPVVRDVDQKDVLQLAAELDSLARRTRARVVELEELQGGTFTITNLGGLGGTAFTPIINYPEVAILGLARSRYETVEVDGQAQRRLMLPLCLSYDHRVIDGADGVRFLRALAAILSDPFELLLER